MGNDQPTPVIRTGTENDIAAITAIFAEEVLHGTASWAYEPSSETELLEKMNGLLEQGYPFLVADVNGAVAGYAYASAYRPREGYRYLVENSIYVAADFRGRGIARTLMNVLIDACTERGFRQMVAVIGDSENHASIALHRSVGFEQVGLLPNIGYKFDRWLDSVLMQRSLGDGAKSAP